MPASAGVPRGRSPPRPPRRRLPLPSPGPCGPPPGCPPGPLPGPRSRGPCSPGPRSRGPCSPGPRSRGPCSPGPRSRDDPSGRGWPLMSMAPASVYSWTSSSRPGCSSTAAVAALDSARLRSCPSRERRRPGTSCGWVSSTAWAAQEAVPPTAVTASRSRARSLMQGAQYVVMRARYGLPGPGTVAVPAGGLTVRGRRPRPGRGSPPPRPGTGCRRRSAPRPSRRSGRAPRPACRGRR